MRVGAEEAPHTINVIPRKFKISKIRREFDLSRVYDQIRVKKRAPRLGLGAHGSSLNNAEELLRQIRDLQDAMRAWKVELELATEKTRIARLAALTEVQRLRSIPAS